MTRDSHDKSRGEVQRGCLAFFNLVFYFFELRFRLLIVFVLFIYRMTRGPFIFSHIPVTDIAQPRGVNAMKVSEH